MITANDRVRNFQPVVEQAVALKVQLEHVRITVGLENSQLKTSSDSCKGLIKKKNYCAIHHYIQSFKLLV